MKNVKLANEKSLISDNLSIYDEIVDKYKYLLEYYINSKIDLFKYEELIKNSGLYIGVNNKYKSLNKFLNLDYIFLINNLFIEKLSIEDINLIMTKFDKENISDELINIVEKTYKNVIYDNYICGDYSSKIYKVCYGPIIPSNMVDNNSLVFKVYYGKNTINFDGDEFIKLHEKQLVFLKELISKLKKEINEKLDIKCEVLLEKDIY